MPSLEMTTVPLDPRTPGDGWDQGEEQPMRIGELLVRQGILTEAQVESVLEIQTERTEPFGSICERLYGVAPEVVEDAWVEQYTELTGSLRPDFDTCDPAVLDLLTRRQAWQFRMVPIRWEDGAVVLATTKSHLQRALRFVTSSLAFPVYFLITDATTLGEALDRYYPMGEVDHGAVERFVAEMAGVKS